MPHPAWLSSLVPATVKQGCCLHPPNPLPLQRVASLEASKGELEGQLSGLAALVAGLESRLREVTSQSEAASTAAELAAATAAKAQAAVGEQVGMLLQLAWHGLFKAVPCINVCCVLQCLLCNAVQQSAQWQAALVDRPSTAAAC
jgi:hypothetical protein